MLHCHVTVIPVSHSLGPVWLSSFTKWAMISCEFYEVIYLTSLTHTILQC